MEKNASDIYDDGLLELRKGNFLQAAILFDKSIKQGFLEEFNDADLVFLYSGIARALIGDKEIAWDRFKKFILSNLLIYDKKIKYPSKKITLDSPFLEVNSDMNDPKITLPGSDEYEKLSSGSLSRVLSNGYIEEFFLEDLPEWWKSHNGHAKKTGSSNKNNTNGVSGSTDGNKEINNKLNELTGLDSVKSEVQKILNLVRVRQLRKNRGLSVNPSTLHMVFTGNPGTGKTSVARIIAETFRDIGLLEKGHLIEVDRSRLVGQYVGHTAPKVAEIVESAIGGVLFIDEAYALSQGGDSDFGKEAIDTLVKLIEDNRDKFVLIVAGYPDLMESFMNTNPGLKSRFYKTICFEDYNADELLEIFLGMCASRGYLLENDVKDKVRTLIEKEQNVKGADFGNGRGVRNIFERVEMNQSDRLARKRKEPSDKELLTFTLQDIK